MIFITYYSNYDGEEYISKGETIPEAGFPAAVSEVSAHFVCANFLAHITTTSLYTI